MEVRQGGDVASPLYCCLLSLSEDAEEVDKQVDEVKVEGESTQEGYFLSSFSCIGSLHKHLFDLLGVISGETYEDKYTDIANHQVETSALDEEHVDQCGNDDADKCHQQILTHGRQVGLGGITDDSHCRKGSCRDEEHSSNRACWYMQGRYTTAMRH